MKLNEWKNKEMFERLNEAYGYGKMEEEEEIDEAHCGRREDEVVEEDVPTVKASDLGPGDVFDGPGDMSVQDGKLVKVVNESQIRTLVREALKRAFNK